MGSSSFFRYSSPDEEVCFSSSSHENRGRSKAQMSLQKIIHIISSSRSCMNTKLESEMKHLRYREGGFEIDLNLTLGPNTEFENPSTGSSAYDGFAEADAVVCGTTVKSSCCMGVSTVEKHSEGECEDPKQVANSKESQVVEEEMKELSEITSIQETGSSEIEMKEDEMGRQQIEHKKEGYLDLLVKAAILISGDFDDEKSSKEETQMKDEETMRCKSKKNRNWKSEFHQDFEEDMSSPVVKSKRGRNQVLPSRFRDSVLEPWKRVSSKPKSNK